MRIFVAGATGVLGRSLIPKLVKDGHEVIGMTHNESNMKWISSLGASPTIADALNKESIADPRKTTIDGIVSLETAVAKIPHHIILRYGAFYGPGTWYEMNERNAVEDYKC